MKSCSRSVLLFGPLVAGFLVASCGESTTGAALPASPSSTGSSAPSAALSTSATWTLQSLAEAGSPDVTIADPSLFTLVFNDDGKLQARADCNRASAGYTVADHALSVGLMASTMAYCASSPVDGQYLSLLGGDSVVTTSGTALQLSSSRGTLRFVR